MTISAKYSRMCEHECFLQKVFKKDLQDVQMCCRAQKPTSAFTENNVNTINTFLKIQTRFFFIFKAANDFPQNGNVFNNIRNYF